MDTNGTKGGPATRKSKLLAVVAAAASAGGSSSPGALPTSDQQPAAPGDNEVPSSEIGDGKGEGEAPKTDFLSMTDEDFLTYLSAWVVKFEEKYNSDLKLKGSCALAAGEAFKFLKTIQTATPQDERNPVRGCISVSGVMISKQPMFPEDSKDTTVKEEMERVSEGSLCFQEGKHYGIWERVDKKRPDVEGPKHTVAVVLGRGDSLFVVDADGPQFSDEKKHHEIWIDKKELELLLKRIPESVRSEMGL